MAPSADKATGGGRDAVLSSDELLEVEEAIAEDQAGEVISGEEFLRTLREPLNRSASR